LSNPAVDRHDDAVATHALVIEDNKRLGDSIARALRTDGFETHVERDGEAGLAAALGATFDVVVLDLRLPRLNGLELLRRFRTCGRTTPVLVVSARDTVEERVTGLEAGADDYLVKPFSVDELIARVHALIRRPAQFQSLTIGELEIDPPARQATVRGEALPLSPREFAVLELLARSAPKLVTRSTLIDGVWGFQFEGLDNALEAQVSALRKRLRLSHAGVRIVTERARGYRLEPENDAAE